MKWISYACCLFAVFIVIKANAPYRDKISPAKKNNQNRLTILPIPLPIGGRQLPLPPLLGQPPIQRPVLSGQFPGLLPGPLQCGTILRCPAEQVFDERSCQCVCAVRISQCPGRSVYNPTTCKCDCNAVCNQFQILNNANCRCEPNPNLQNNPGNNPLLCAGVVCPSPFTLNSLTCRCECPLAFGNACPSPQVRNPSTCRCECPPRQCSAVSFQDPNTCQCTCRQDFPCPRGQVRNLFSCQCECNRRTCPFPQVLNTDTCDCECPRRVCSGIKFLNPTTCQCECSNSARNCDTSRQLFNPDTCQCDCSLVLVTVEVTVPGGPGPLVPGPAQPLINPFFFQNRLSRTPGGRIRTGQGRNFFSTFGTTGLFNGGFTNGFFPTNGRFINIGKRKRRALKLHRKRRRTDDEDENGTIPRNIVIIRPRQQVPPPLVPGPTLPPTFRRETRLVSPPCPAGTILNRATCSCL